MMKRIICVLLVLSLLLPALCVAEPTTNPLGLYVADGSLLFALGATYAEVKAAMGGGGSYTEPSLVIPTFEEPQESEILEDSCTSTTLSRKMLGLMLTNGSILSEVEYDGVRLRFDLTEEWHQRFDGLSLTEKSAIITATGGLRDLIGTEYSSVTERNDALQARYDQWLVSYLEYRDALRVSEIIVTQFGFSSAVGDYVGKPTLADAPYQTSAYYGQAGGQLVPLS